MSNEKKKLFFRWLVLTVILVNVAFNYAYTALGAGDKTVKEVSDIYKNLFTPAPYAFSIWGLIYLSFIGYGIFQVLPKTIDKILYNRLVGPMVFANLLGICWIIAYTNNMIGLSVAIIGIMLVNALMMFRLVRNRIRDCEYSPWLTIPFSLYAGWITVASIANFTQWLVALGYGSTGLLGSSVMAALCIFTGALAIIVGYKHRDWIYPLVVSWALIAIYVADKTQDHIAALASLLSGIAAGTFTAGYAVYRVRLYSKNPMYID